MTGWLRRWGMTTLMWACCGAGLGSDLAGAHIAWWVTALWIVNTAGWVGISRIQDSTIRIQRDTIGLVQRQRDLLLQKQKAGLS